MKLTMMIISDRERYSVSHKSDMSGTYLAHCLEGRNTSPSEQMRQGEICKEDSVAANG